MTRLWIILSVAAFCVATATRPDPRMQAAIDALSEHSHQTELTADGGFYCPMDPSVRALQPGRCPTCGMTLVEGAPDIVEYRLDLGVEPKVPRAGDVTRLTFGLLDPRRGQPVRRFEIVHEQLFHVFVVSEDLSFFVHTHPERAVDEDFHLDLTFPKPGMYRVLSDFYPSDGSPQLITSTIIVPGGDADLAIASIEGDVAARATENARVELSLQPEHVRARESVTMRFRVSPGDGFERYLGAWGHMLAASADLIDMIHNHPSDAGDPGGGAYKDIAFTMVFPRAGVYRVWMQFQREGVVNTVAFDVPVEETTP
jgi:hypothetical protein